MNKLNLGLIGGGFAGQVHSIAFRMMKGFFGQKVKNVSLKVLVTQNESKGRKLAEKFGIDEWMGDWRKLMSKDNIHAVIIATPNYKHKDMVLEAVGKGKHVLCEKPFALNAQDAKEMYDAAENAGLKHGVNFNYRKTPAILLIKKWIDEGRLGKIFTFRSSYLQDWGTDKDGLLSWRFQKKYAGAGSLGDLGAHIIDMARFLVGEFSDIAGIASTRINKRPVGALDFGVSAEKNDKIMGDVDVDDICDVLFTFKNGAQGSLSSSRLAKGRKNHFEFEIYGTGGSIYFDWERRNEVLLYSQEKPNDQSGFSKVIVGATDHPYSDALWAIPGLGIGFAEPFSIQLFEFIDAIYNDKDFSPSFYDGWKNNQVLDAINVSIKERRFIAVL